MKLSSECVLVVSICLRVKGHSLQILESCSQSVIYIKVKGILLFVCFLSCSSENLGEYREMKVPMAGILT